VKDVYRDRRGMLRSNGELQFNANIKTRPEIVATLATRTTPPAQGELYDPSSKRLIKSRGVEGGDFIPLPEWRSARREEFFK